MDLHSATKDDSIRTRITLERAPKTTHLENTRKELDLTNPNPTRYMLTTWRGTKNPDTSQTTHCL